MGKYRKKPVVIEAFEFNGDLKGSDGNYYVPLWAEIASKVGILFYAVVDGGPPCELFVKTLEGDMHVSVGDFIIKGVKNEIYPCKPDIFEATYEPAE